MKSRFSLGCCCYGSSGVIITVTNCAVPAVNLTLSWYSYDSTAYANIPPGFPLLGPRTETLTYFPNTSNPNLSTWKTPIGILPANYAQAGGSCRFYQFAARCVLNEFGVWQVSLGLEVGSSYAVDGIPATDDCCYTDPDAEIIAGFGNCSLTNSFLGDTTHTPFMSSFVNGLHSPSTSGSILTGGQLQPFDHGVLSL